MRIEKSSFLMYTKDTKHSHSHSHNYYTLIKVLPVAEEVLLRRASVVLKRKVWKLTYIYKLENV